MKRSLAFLGGLLLCAAVAIGQIQSSSPEYNESFVAGRFVAKNYSGYTAQVVNGNAATGSASITVRGGYAVLPDGRSVSPFAVGVPLVVMDAAPEFITPTAVSGCVKGSSGTAGGQDLPFVTCTITATFAATHGAYALVQSGTNGLAEAENDAVAWGGGIVTISPGWSLGLITGCTNCKANLAAVMAVLLPYANVSFEDNSSGLTQYWNASPSTASFIAAPTTLTAQAACDATHTFCSDATVVGTWAATGTLFGCITYVDIMGNESACSATASFTNTSLKAIDVGAPAASTGAVGYAIYLSLSAGTYAQAFRVPITSSICTLTKLETVTPACAVTNATYGQVGSTFAANTLFLGGAQIAATTVNTAMHFPVSGGISTAASNVGAVTAHTTYAYAPGTRLGAPFETTFTSFTAVATQATTVPGTMGSINLPPGFMNFIGKTIRITGKFTTTQPGSTSEVFAVAWDADGTNTTTNPVTACNFTATSTGTNAVWNGTFTCLLTTVTTGATGTLMASGQLVMNLAAATTAGELYILPESATAATASVNLTGSNRLDIISTPTGSTQSATTLLSLVAEVVN